jgi:aminopeptidase N
MPSSGCLIGTLPPNDMNRAAPQIILGLLAAAVLAGIWLVGLPGPSKAVEAGISHGLAIERASRVSSLSYEMRLSIPSARAEAVRGEITATFDLSNAGDALLFDFAQPTERLLSVTANGRTLAPVTENGHVVIPSRELVRGRNVVRFTFVAGDAALNRQDEFLYSLFVPARASTTFPCFDQPDLKARWRLSLDVPDGWAAISNGNQTGRMAARGRVSYLFDETPPISTYLFSFAAGRFQIETARRGNRTFRMVHRETDTAKLARNREAIFDLHANALDWLERYTGVLYPFGKFDFLLVPSFQFSGMEHPGAVLYNANSLLLEEAATEQQLLNRANVISHETAHMWFGDLVTMRWFDDVWMKEVFANFMAAKIVNPSFPAMNHDLRFFVQHYPSAYEIDRTAGANPIRQNLDNLSDAGSLYGAIIYQKAPIVMRQLERLIGAEALRQGLREYLTQHGFSNATWPELVAILDRHSTRDLSAWSQAWVSQAGRPLIRTDLRVSNGRIDRLAFIQVDPRGRTLTWPQEIAVALGRGADVETVSVTLDKPEVVVASAQGRSAPDWVLPVAGGLGYGAFELDQGSRDYFATRANSILDPVNRGAAFVTRWEEMLDGRIPLAALRRALLADLQVESVELNLQLLLDYTRATFWRFTPATERAAWAAELEPVLRRGLERATTTSAKAAWFTALRSIATTDATVKWLEEVWARKRTILGLPLAEVDESDLAFDLAVRDVPNADAILAAQLERITNADRKARFAFIAPALSRDAVKRESFFSSLRSPAQRAREAWVLDAVRYLHHPLRAQASAALVRPALDLTLEIKRTGDIFFPKRWADATLAGYQTPAVADDVRAFIDLLPDDYPPRLRWVLLSSADPLFRASTLLGR